MFRHKFRHTRLPVVFFTLLLIVFATLGAQDAFSRAPQDAVARTSDDGEDIHRALEVLRDAIIDAARTNKTDPISDVLSAFAQRDATDFFVGFTDYTPFETCHWIDDSINQACVDWSPDVSARPPGVSPEEWKRFALLLDDYRPTEFDTSDRSFAVTMVDLNEDGVRDLLVRTPPEGTGHWERTYVFQSDDVAGFRLAVPGEGERTSFEVNGRGSDHDLRLLRIKDRSYLAFRAAEYGEEVITLHRPLLSSDSDDADEAVRVWYEVTHHVDVDGNVHEGRDGATPDVSDIDHAVLDQLNLIFENRARAAYRCPIPAGQRDIDGNDGVEDPDSYWPWITAPHYIMDRIDIFAVETGDECYKAQLMAPRGTGVYSFQYDRCCWIELQDGPDSEFVEVPLKTHRVFKGAELTPFSGHIVR